MKKMKEKVDGSEFMGYIVCPCLAVLIFVPLFVIGAVIYGGHEQAAQGIVKVHGEDGGLTQFSDPCTISAIYHTNVVTRHIAHVHHPHSPKRARRLGEVQPVAAPSPSPPPVPVAAAAARHEHTPRKPADAPVSPSPSTTPLPKEEEEDKEEEEEGRSPAKAPAAHAHATDALLKGKLSFDDGSKYEGEFKMVDDVSVFHGKGAYTHPDGLVDAGTFEGGEYVCEKCGEHRRRGRSLEHRHNHWIDFCYDRFAYAITPGTSWDDITGGLDTLSQMNTRMTGAGYAVLPSAAPPPPGSTKVVLSAPLNVPRYCDFGYLDTMAPVDSLRRYIRYSYNYTPPSRTIAQSCADGSLSAWQTNYPRTTWLDDNTGTQDDAVMNKAGYTMWDQGRVPWYGIAFNKQAPTEWELAKWSTTDIWALKQKQDPPKIVDSGGPCEGGGWLVENGMSEGCMTRTKPAGWDGGCPPTAVGDSYPCYYINSASFSSSDAELIRRQHGCFATSTASISTPMSEEDIPKPKERADYLTDYFSASYGAGPPNPDCLTIFPPSWRMVDLFVGNKLSLISGFNPYYMFLGAIITASVLLGCAFCSCLGACGLQKKLDNYKKACGESPSGMPVAMGTASNVA